MYMEVGGWDRGGWGGVGEVSGGVSGMSGGGGWAAEAGYTCTFY